MKLERNDTSVLAAAALGALLLTSCAAQTDTDPTSVEPTSDAYAGSSPAASSEPTEEEPLTGDDAVAEGVVVPDSVNLDEVFVDPGRGPLSQAEVDSMNPANELDVVCSDSDALAALEGHTPAGWPQDWDGEGAMPNPECHPDFIEIRKWDKFEEFHSCWEGPETSTTVRDTSMTDADTYRILWNQSQARADWEWSDYGEPIDRASDECWDAYERATGGSE